MMRKAPIAALALFGAKRVAAQQPCPSLPAGEDTDGEWRGFPLASDDSLVLIHDVPFKGISVPVSGLETATAADFSAATFSCEVMGATGACSLVLDSDDGQEGNQALVMAEIVFPDAYATTTLKLRISDSSNRCSPSEISREVYVYGKTVALAPLLIVLILTPITREVYSSLGIGGIIGTWILKRDLWDAWLAYWHDRLIAQVTGGFANIMWTMLLMGGIGGLAMRAGGIQGIGAKASSLIKDSFLGQAVVFCLGFIIFMDDYANTIIVGFSLQPITEAMRVSREKLSFLVDCTASPVAGIMPLSTWIAHELSQIELGLEAMENPPDDSAFLLFTRSISRRFYSFYMLTLVAAVFLMGRDWGFMYQAEVRARRGDGTFDRNSGSGAEVPGEAPKCYTMVATENFLMIAGKPGIPGRWWNAVVPFFLIIAIFTPLLFYYGAVFGCPEEGWDASPRDIIGCADAFPTLHWTCGSVICIQIVMYASQYSKEWNGCLLWPKEAIDAALNGGMLYYKAIMCLLLAFTYARTVRDLLLDKILVDGLGDSVSEAELPALVFVLCALFSLATGTSWGTMAVFMPVVLPLAEVVGVRESGTLSDNLLLTTISAVLGGAVSGDHCSPVSDTTILSAAASQCTLMDHTKTQLPYAFFCGVMSILFGFMPAGAGAPPGLCIVLGLILVPSFHFCITLLGLVIPNFGGNVPVFIPDPEHEQEGFIIGEGPMGTLAALKNMLGKEVWRTAAGGARKSSKPVDNGNHAVTI